MSLRCDLDLGDSKATFFVWRSGLWWCCTIPSLMINGSAIQKIFSGQTFIGILKFRCDLGLEYSYPFLSQDTELLIKFNKTSLVAKWSVVQKIKYKQSVFDYMSLRCDLDLNSSEHIFRITLRFIMMHHHTKIHADKYSLTFWPFTVILTLNKAISSFHSILWFMMMYPSKFGCKLIRSLEDIVEIVTFWLYKPSLTLKIANQYCPHDNPKFGYKRLSSSGDVVRTKSGQADTRTQWI